MQLMEKKTIKYQQKLNNFLVLTNTMVRFHNNHNIGDFLKSNIIILHNRGKTALVVP